MYATSKCSTWYKASSKDSSIEPNKSFKSKNSVIKVDKLLDLEKGHFKIESNQEDFKVGFIFCEHWSITNWIEFSKLKQIFNTIDSSVLKTYENPINYAMLKYGITTFDRQTTFLAQIHHESGGLRYWEELASGRAYEGRKDLGNTQPGDGVRFKGRGPIQLTGRSNYRTFGKQLGIDLESNPTLAKNPKIGFLVSALFWSMRGLNMRSGSSLDSFRRVTRVINGGFNGLEDRIKQWERIKNILK